MRRARYGIRKERLNTVIESATPEIKKRKIEALQSWTPSDLNRGSPLPPRKKPSTVPANTRIIARETSATIPQELIDPQLAQMPGQIPPQDAAMIEVRKTSAITSLEINECQLDQEALKAAGQEVNVLE
jgi:hypothetical protein